jgi:uncharacterized protein DUF6894
MARASVTPRTQQAKSSFVGMRDDGGGAARPALVACRIDLRWVHAGEVQAQVGKTPGSRNLLIPPDFFAAAGNSLSASGLLRAKDAAMPRYYFDLRDDTGVALDEEGLELASARAVQAEAAKSVADMARDAILSAPPAGARQTMAIDVRDAKGPVMQVKFSFAIETFRPPSTSRDH